MKYLPFVFSKLDRIILFKTLMLVYVALLHSNCYYGIVTVGVVAYYNFIIKNYNRKKWTYKFDFEFEGILRIRSIIKSLWKIQIQLHTIK